MYVPMSSIRFVILAFALAAARPASAVTDPIFANHFESGASGGGGEPAALAGITAAHNAVRASVGVAPLVWDDALAASAQTYGATCADTQAPIGLIDHNAGRSSGFPYYVGENIYGTSGTATGADAVNLWAAEKQYYNYSTNSCAAGQICGHYTQLVWSTSTHVGCAISTCPSLTYGNAVICDYGPGGNTGGRPY